MRLAIPKAYRSELPDTVYITCENDHLCIYSDSEFNKHLEILNSALGPDHGKMRDAFSLCEKCSFDMQGRIRLPLRFLNMLNIEQNSGIICIGVYDHVCIYREDIYEQLEYII